MQDLVGKQIDTYRITDRLGMGGMAVVYKAYDVRLEREVALKLIRTEAIPPDQAERVLKRFEREAKAQSKFSHPNIVPVFDFGEWHRTPYLVMAYIPEGTLKDQIGQPIPWRQALSWLTPIADALAYAHQRGVVHRDIKPANILINQSGRPVLTDFGIAKVLESEDATLTGTGFGVGTPAYMAPEQWKGQTCEASDQYALATVFYELITGNKPFNADTPAAVMIQQATEPLRAPSELIPGIPESVERVLYKALALKPADRYEDMRSFYQALLALQTSAAVDGHASSRDVVGDHLKSSEVPDIRKKEPSSGDQAKIPKWLLWVGIPLVLMVFGILAAGLVLIFQDHRLEGELSQAAADPVSATGTSTLQPSLTISPTSAGTVQPTWTQTTTPTQIEDITPTQPADEGIGSTRENEIDGAMMVFVPAGEFLMGSSDEHAEDDEQPKHTVMLDAYWIYAMEVTSFQYRECIKEGACSGNLADFGESQYPAVDVNWSEADQYCTWAGGRLPSEAEWEKAARGTDGRTYPWGEASPRCTLANYAGCIEGFMPVGNYPDGASPYGALDMAGNVWEWVGDWYSSDYYNISPETNPKGPASGTFKVLRGGSWNNYGISDLRVSNRHANVPDNPNENFGFRCVQTP